MEQAGAERPGPGGDGEQVQEAQQGGGGRTDKAQPDQPEGALAKTVGSSERREARSKTKLATQAPIGTVTRMGWKGCP
jgi:hypothetical protein